MSSNTKLQDAVRLALGLGAGTLALGFSPGALAQDEGAEQVEEITVTGSRIKKKDFASNAPVTTVGFEQIELTGTVNTESLLNALPQTVPGLDRTSNNPGNGTATVDLRGLGSQRTLVLINGTRVVPTTAGGSVDINAIPTALIQNIEVLTGGASAVYGSDAVAGVINFILKDDFEGVALNYGYETTEEGDATIISSDITLGANLYDGRGNVTLNFAYTDRDPLFQGDRDFAFFAQFDDTDASGNPILINGGSTGIPGTSNFAGAWLDVPGRSTGFSPDSAGVTFDPDGSIRPFDTSSPVGNDFYNYAPVNYIQLPQTRYQMTALGHFDATDNATFYGRAMFTSSKVPQQLAPTPIFQTTTFTVDGSPFLTPAAQAVLSGNNLDQLGLGNRLARVFSDGASAFNATNTCTNCLFDASYADTMGGPPDAMGDPTGDGIDDDLRLDTPALVDTDGDGIADTATGFMRRRLLEVGPRISDDSFTSYQVQVGLRGTIGTSNWDYDAYLQQGNVTFAGNQLGNVNRDRFDQALLLDLSDPTGGTCTDTSTSGSTIGCAPINIFGQGNISQAGADFLKVSVAATADYDQVVYGVAFTGDLGESFVLPGGPIGVAVGYESIRNDFAFRPSQDLSSGDIAGFNGSPPVTGGFDADSVFVEAYLPILSGATYAEVLDLELAYRASDYTTAGNVESYKIAGSWAPVDSVRFRGGFNVAVRAPSIGELFSPNGENFPAAVDPCAADGMPNAATGAICIGTGVPAGIVGSPAINLPAGQVRAITGGNPLLHEEEADTYTVGVVFTPDFIEGFSVSVDYFDIEITDFITEFGGGASNVLNICYDATNPNGGLGSEFCNAVNRRADGTINDVALVQFNVAQQTLTGIDVLASWDTEVFDGDLRISYVGTILDESEFTAFDGAVPRECAGKFGVDICQEPVPDYNHRMTFNWTRDDITAQLAWRYIGSVDDDDPTFTYFVEQIDAVSYFDLSGVYRFTENYSVTLGIDNLIDEEPQILGDNQEQANTWPATYDVFGRTYFMRATARF